jgi:predicted TIM-barrel fold metal-dependent hydrolase
MPAVPMPRREIRGEPMTTQAAPQHADGQLKIAGYVDCDSHVEEPAAAWQHLEAEYHQRRPLLIDLRGTDGLATQDAYWLIDGRQYPSPTGPGASFFGSPPVSTLALRKPYGVGSQSLEDVPARLADLDRNNIRLSVIFPTVFLTGLTTDVAYEAALMRSYNTWLAERCSISAGRLRFVAMIPWRNPAAAVAEVRRAKGLGAVGLYTMGTAGEMMLHDRSLDPIYSAAEEHGLPVCVHTGYSQPSLKQNVDNLYMSISSSLLLPLFAGFVAITGGGVLDRHPGLRVGFFEAGGDWLPYFVTRMGHYHPVVPRIFNLPVPKKAPAEYLAEGRIYASIEGHDILLPQVIELLGEDRLLASADMPHAEGRDSELEEVLERDDVPARIREKILTTNTLRFYNLEG